MKSLLFAGVAAAGLLVIAGTSPSQAGAVTGAVWENSTTNSQNVTTVPSGPPSATFTPGALNYMSGSLYTIGEFLGPAATATLSAPIGGDTLDNTVFQFTGTVGLKSGNNSFVVGHDDGVVLTIAGFGTVVNAPGPTSFTSSPFNVFNPGAAGNFSFTLNYGECCGAPGDLLFSINDVVVGAPEPAGLAILGTGLAGLGLVMRRRRD